MAPFRPFLGWAKFQGCLHLSPIPLKVSAGFSDPHPKCASLHGTRSSSLCLHLLSAQVRANLGHKPTEPLCHEASWELRPFLSPLFPMPWPGVRRPIPGNVQQKEKCRSPLLSSTGWAPQASSDTPLCSLHTQWTREAVDHKKKTPQGQCQLHHPSATGPKVKD